MNKKHYISILLILIIALIIFYREAKEIHSLTIYKLSKNQNAIIEKVIVIDSVGNISLNRKKTKYQFDITTLNKKIIEFIEKENAKKIESNKPWDIVKPPNNNKQKIYFSIIFLDDYHQNLIKPVYYSWKKTDLKINYSEYPIYKYLNTKDSLILRKLLK